MEVIGVDFAALPPEINSGLMYSGPGSGPMLAAATAWDGLAVELNSTAASYGSVVSSLTSEPWLGPASAAMASAVAPYLVWLQTTAAQAAHTAAQVRVAAAGYEAAFAMTVPPAVIAANRTLLMSLIATNLLGQNAAAIAATQAHYAEMWAQDTAAMYGYSASSATATQLTPFPPPEQATNPGGQAGQAAAAAQAAGSAAEGTTQNMLSAVPQTLQQLALPLQAAPAQAGVDDAIASTAFSGLSMSSAYHSAIGSANFFQRVGSQFAVLSSGKSEPTTTDIMGRVDRIALATGAVSPEDLAPADGDHGHLGPGSWQNWLKWLKGMGAHVFHSSATADMGQAPAVGGLSVPHSWSATAPEIHLASAELAGADAAPTVEEGGGTGSLGAQAALAGMAGRALAGTVAPGGRQGIASSTRDRIKSPRRSSETQPTRSAAELREVPELIREFGRLRDSGLLTDEEFDAQKERLLGLNLRHPGR